MAKFEEADPRWIVQERNDGQNVGNWHWSERDVLPWVKHRLAELFDGLTVVEDGAMRVVAGRVEHVGGEAIINIRKGKTIPSYELDIKVAWTGEIVDGEGRAVATGEGFIQLPYVAEENHDESPELKVTLPVGKEDSAGLRLKEAIVKRGQAKVLEKIQTFVDELHKGGPVKIVKGAGVAPSSEPAANGSSSAPAPKPAPKPAPAPSAAASASNPPKSSSAVTRADHGDSIEMHERFRCRPEDLYLSLIDQQRVMAFSRAPAQVPREVGAPFSMFGGSIQGRHVELIPGQRIVQEWRFNTWPDGVYSRLEIELKEPEHGDTRVTLLQTGIPHEDRFGNTDVAETTKRGWEEMVFSRIRTMFGF